MKDWKINQRILFSYSSPWGTALFVPANGLPVKKFISSLFIHSKGKQLNTRIIIIFITSRSSKTNHLRLSYSATREEYTWRVLVLEYANDNFLLRYEDGSRKVRNSHEHHAWNSESEQDSKNKRKISSEVNKRKIYRLCF